MGIERIASAALPAAIMLLASCSDRPALQKADLQQAAEAAKVAGEAEQAQKYAPMQLGPAKQAVIGKPAVASDSGEKAQLVAMVPNPSPVQRATGATVTAAPAIAQPTLAPPTMAQPVKVQPIASGPAPSLAEDAAATAVKVADKRPVNGTAIHLASYREIASAQRGWRILSENYRELAALKPLYVALDVPGKGHVLRLYGTGADTRTLKEICHEMLAAGAYCADNIAF
jgi:hypothetical protein